MTFGHFRLPAGAFFALAFTVAPLGAQTVPAKLAEALNRGCKDEASLRGVLVRSLRASDSIAAELTVDNSAQVDAFKAFAVRILESDPDWKSEFPRGILVEQAKVVPVRSKLLPELRAAFAAASGDDASVTSQVRLDDVYYSPQSPRPRLIFEGVCIAEATAISELTRRKEVEDRLNAMAPTIMGVAAAKDLTFLIDSSLDFRLPPAKQLQRHFVDNKIDDVILKGAWYDANGTLHIQGKTSSASRVRDLEDAAANRFAADPSYRRPGNSFAIAFDLEAVTPWPLDVGALQRDLASTSIDLLKRTRIDRISVLPADVADGPMRLVFTGLCSAREFGTDSVVPQKKMERHLVSWCQGRRGMRELGSTGDLRNVVFHVSPGNLIQNQVPKHPLIDGVCISADSDFDASGRLRLQGFWLGSKQDEAFKSAVRKILQEKDKEFLIARGISTEALQSIDTDRLLMRLREWVANNIDEARVERLYFDNLKKLRIFGRFLNPGDDQRILDQLELYLQDNPADIRKFLERSATEKTSLFQPVSLTAAQDPGSQELVPLPFSINATLRALVAGPRVPTRGIFLERCRFDTSNTLIPFGLLDNEAQRDIFARLIEDVSRRKEWKDILSPGWNLKKMDISSLANIVKELRTLRFQYESLDGTSISDAYHDADMKLVLAGVRTRRPRSVADDAEYSRPLSRAAIGGRRAQFGVKFHWTEVVADHRIADTAIARSVDLLKQYWPESIRMVDSATPSLVPPYHAFTKVRNTTLPIEISATCLDYLDIALFHRPNDTTAWFLRGMCRISSGNLESAARDLRRLRVIELREPELRTDRLDRLELLQGPLRTVTSDYAEYIAVVTNNGQMPVPVRR